MNSDQIYLAIEHIASDASKKFKEQCVRNYGKDDGFRTVLRAALDPMVTYGIAKLPAASRSEAVGARHFTSETWQGLGELATRHLSGNAARTWVEHELGCLTLYSGELLRRIITKDLRAGFTESTVNRAIPGLIPTFDCMLAHPWDPKRVQRWPVYIEPKLDGVRVLAFVTICSIPQVKFFSRSGKEFTAFENLKQPLIDAFLRDRATEEGMEFVIDAEVVSGNFNKTVSEVRRKDEQMTDAILVVFDVLTREEFESPEAISSDDVGWETGLKKPKMMEGYCTVAPRYNERRERVEIFTKCVPLQLASRLLRSGQAVAAPAFEAHSESEVHDLYELFRTLGLEGAIVKLNCYYRKDRDYGWMKLKAEQSVDVPIVGAEEGTGKYAGTLGALIVLFNGVEVRVSGMTDELRRDMWEAYQHDIAGGQPRLLLDRLAEVEYHEVTPDGSLRHPRFKRYRDDKAVALA